MTWLLSLLIGLIVVLLITVATGYFVAQEFAYMTVDRARLRARAEDGDAGARRALRVTERTSFMLSGAQLGITVTGLLVGYVAEPLVGAAIGTMLGGVGVPTAVGISIGTVSAPAAVRFSIRLACTERGQGQGPMADRLFSSMATITTSCGASRGPLIWIRRSRSTVSSS